MSATYSKQSRLQREPLSPQTIAARLFVVLIVISTFLAAFVFPWVFTGGR